MIIKYHDALLRNMFLANLGIDDVKEVNGWWTKASAMEYRIDGLSEMKDVVLRFKDKGVVICGDYDVDGITSTGILTFGLKWAGFTNVRYMIPKRFSEGFGLNDRMVDEISPDELILTCDNGIAQIDAIKHAKDKGITVCVIDHHEPVVENGVKILPEADAIIDPNAIENSAEFNGYCGAGLSYRFACELLGDKITPEQKAKLLSIAAIGTIGDVMKLHEENYYIVRKGIGYLLNSSTTTMGLNTLCRKLNIEDHICSTDVAFSVCPAINAISRLNDEGAKDAVSALLSDTTEADAEYFASLLIEWNKTRKTLKTEAIELAEKSLVNEAISRLNDEEAKDAISTFLGAKDAISALLSDTTEADAEYHASLLIEWNKTRKTLKTLVNEVVTKPIILNIPNLGEGILGLVCSTLVEKYHVPVICFTTNANGDLKASARSCGNCHIKEKLDMVNDQNSMIFVNYGGHEGAAGLTIKADLFDTFKELFIKACDDFLYTDEQVYIEITVDQVNTVANEMAKYEPYGEGNPMPQFYIRDFRPEVDAKRGLKKLEMKGDTVKFIQRGISVLGFGMASQLTDVDNTTESLSVYGTISDNWWKGRLSRQILASQIIKVDPAY